MIRIFNEAEEIPEPTPFEVPEWVKNLPDCSICRKSYKLAA